MPPPSGEVAAKPTESVSAGRGSPAAPYSFFVGAFCERPRAKFKSIVGGDLPDAPPIQTATRTKTAALRQDRISKVRREEGTPPLPMKFQPRP